MFSILKHVFTAEHPQATFIQKPQIEIIHSQWKNEDIIFIPF